MALVYERALLTLVATTSSDRTGLFVQSNLDLLTALPYRQADNRCASRHTKSASGAGIPSSYTLRSTPEPEAMQERIISRHIVHFAADQPYWECRRQRRYQIGTTHNFNRSATRPSSPVNVHRYVVSGDADVHSFVTRMEQLLATHGSKISSGTSGRRWSKPTPSGASRRRSTSSRG